MVLDTSAVVAILFDEPGRRVLTKAIEADPVRLLSAALYVGEDFARTDVPRAE